MSPNDDEYLKRKVATVAFFRNTRYFEQKERREREELAQKGGNN